MGVTDLDAKVVLVFADCSDMSTRDETSRTYSGGDSQPGCQQVTDTPVRFDHSAVKEYVLNMKHVDIWANFGYIFVAIVVFRVLALLSESHVNG